MLRRAVIVFIALSCAPSTPGAADTTERALAYTVTFRGLDVAEISGAARETDSAYAAAVQIRSTGLAAAFARVRFDMQVEGFRAGDTLSPVPLSRNAVDTGSAARRGGVALARGRGRSFCPIRRTSKPGSSVFPPRRPQARSDRLTLLWRLARPQPGDPPFAIGGPRSSTARVWPPSRWEGRR
jgi:hypothetical protein